jgi:tRNA pseudouridine13 synthase
MQSLLYALEHKGLNQERRPLWLLAQDLQWQFPALDEVQVSFSLPPGQYATSLLRESVTLTDVSTKVRA